MSHLVEFSLIIAQKRRTVIVLLEFGCRLTGHEVFLCDASKTNARFPRLDGFPSFLWFVQDVPDSVLDVGCEVYGVVTVFVLSLS